jgi:GT2 family glycosyltransferase
MGKSGLQIIPIGMLTYKRPDLLMRTLESFINHNRIHLDRFRFFILVQACPDPGTMAVINYHANLFDEVLLSKANMGAAKGTMTILGRCVEKYPESKYLMILEDDWESQDSLGNYLDEILHFLETDESVGYIRLRAAHQRVFNKNRMTKKGIRYIPKTDLIFKSNGHFTANPVIFRREILQHFAEYPIQKEIHMVEVCHYLDECGAQLRKDCFWHIGLSQRSRPWRG